MSKNTDDWPEFDLAADPSIDELKEEQKQKLAAADEAYASSAAERQTAVTLPDVDEAENDDRHGAWMGGLILIAIGSYFLLSNLTGFQLNNWWALFILIPAFGVLGKGFSSYRQAGRMTSEAWGEFAGGSIMLLIASAFLFGLNWGLIWPFFLIIGGIGAIFGARTND